MTESDKVLSFGDIMDAIRNCPKTPSVRIEAHKETFERFIKILGVKPFAPTTAADALCGIPVYYVKGGLNLIRIIEDDKVIRAFTVNSKDEILEFNLEMFVMPTWSPELFWNLWAREEPFKDYKPPLWREIKW